MSSVDSNIFKFILAVFLLVKVNTLNIPSYHKPCKFSDPKFEQCAVSVANTVMENFRKGDTTLMDGKLKEIKFPFVRLSESDVNVNISDLCLLGFEDLKILKIKKVPGKNRLETVINIKNVTMPGEYSLDMILDEKHIARKGRGYISFGPNHYKCNFEWKLADKNGDKYMEVTKIETKLDMDNVVHMIDGVDNKLLDENWAEYWTKLMPVIDPYLQKIFHIFTDTMFNEIPYNKLFLD